MQASTVFENLTVDGEHMWTVGFSGIPRSGCPHKVKKPDLILFSCEGKFTSSVQDVAEVDLSTNNRTRQLSENRTVTMEGEVKIGISLPEYKIVYERGSEETVTVRQKDSAMLEERAHSRREQGKLFIRRVILKID